MKKKVLIIAIVVVILSILILFIVNPFRHEDENFKYLKCSLTNNKYKNYEEDLEFMFVDNILTVYTRDEVITSNNIDEDIKVFERQKEEVPNYIFLDYDVTSDDNKIYVKTKISAISSIDFYNDYMSEKNLSFSDTINEVEEELKNQGYTCKISYKKESK